MFRYPKSAADVDHRGLRELSRSLRQKTRRVLPASNVKYTAADMRLQSNDAYLRSAGTRTEVRQFADWHAKFRASASRADMTVMTPPYARVEAQKDTLTVKEFGPCTDAVGIVDRDAHALTQGPGVFGAWRKIGREQDAVGFKSWEFCLDLFDFPA